MISVAIFDKGIENWRRTVGYGIEDPPAAIRPSMAQYTGFLENYNNLNSLYVKIELFAPTIRGRTVRSNSADSLSTPMGMYGMSRLSATDPLHSMNTLNVGQSTNDVA